ncbi:hypothetical protein HELRODRAFT_117169 [Helobdella robusta]|uniref:DNA helicase n=1 Tax=Helobdella robusta TaxID=6412 RepID=T1EGK8_HELRO|nr:hypothetical protein HELRODRAFT_117169 [Helobdella robusta]ESO09638.1 hypothetical protein HELRODRAFT_117169 [Helobdella robusta]
MLIETNETLISAKSISDDNRHHLTCQKNLNFTLNSSNLNITCDINNPTNKHIIIPATKTTSKDQNNTRTTNICDGFDISAGRTWIYPSNQPIRNYQYNISQKALYNNTLVCLPTGLGKTFVAAVVMYNFYRWYPEGKVIFMAPTKPLVAQQIEACHNIMGIPMETTAEMTGAMPPEVRKKSWISKRSFYLTPQVMMNDLQRGVCPALKVKCLVIDEAHKALGNHAYCQVVRELSRYEGEFRILALSATPGSDIKAVQQVLNNLLISHIELRTEESLDIQPYTHHRKIEKIVIAMGDEINIIRDLYLKIINVFIQRLRKFGAIYNKDIRHLSKFMILKAREMYRKNTPSNLTKSQRGLIECDYAICMSLYHGYELMYQHGLRTLHAYIKTFITDNSIDERQYANPNLTQQTQQQQKQQITSSSSSTTTTTTTSSSQKIVPPLKYGHPKLKKLEEIIIGHFTKFQNDGQETRAMIFSSYRDSVNEITQLLNKLRPLVKPMSLIGHSSSVGGAKGFNQKDQLKVMKRFREGGYNTLVATCIGEEGLDIGEVDLIVCFDAHKSPIRLVQRMGRTGRKREGRVVMLVTEGKEEQVYNTSQSHKNNIVRLIQQQQSNGNNNRNNNNNNKLQLYNNNPLMVPQYLNPTCEKIHIQVLLYNNNNSNNNNVGQKIKNGKRSSSSKFKNKPEQEIVTDEFFDLFKREFYDENSGNCLYSLPPISSGMEFLKFGAVDDHVSLFVCSLFI